MAMLTLILATRSQGKWLEHLQAFVKALAIKDPVVSALSVSRQISYALYLIHDSFQWVHGSKAYVFAPETYNKIAKRAAWVASGSVNASRS